MPRWTLESRARQALKVKHDQPWRHSTGPTSPAGKAESRKNALKDGLRSAAYRAAPNKTAYRAEAALRRFLREASRRIG